MMSKFNTGNLRPKVASPVTTTGVRTTTAQGATAFERTGQSDLYLLAVSNLIDKKTFHEAVGRRGERFVELVRAEALADPSFVTGLFPWLRSEGFMRTGSVMGAAEAAKVLCDAGRYAGVEDMVDGSLQRADEPGEFIAYWLHIAGKGWPKKYLPVKKGIKRAVARLYTEFAYIKWDSERRAYRFADVIELVHPKPKGLWQSDLFRMIIDRRHDRFDTDLANLPMVKRAGEWHEMAATYRRAQENPELTRTVSLRELLDPAFIQAAGLTWEAVRGSLGGLASDQGMWSAVIPNMGVMALLKNLRNFDEAHITQEDIRTVQAALSDAERVRRSKVFPFQFLVAHRAVRSVRWSEALEDGLNASMDLVPALKGRTLILVDRSPSMFPEYSRSVIGENELPLSDKAALFGTALALRAENADLFEFGGEGAVTDRNGKRGAGGIARRVKLQRGASVLRTVDSFGGSISGTDIPGAVRETFKVGLHDRVVIITDEQSRPGYLPSNMYHWGGSRETLIDDLIPASTPVYLWNLEGYKGSILEASKPTRHVFGGLSDASFKLLASLESGRKARWPWLA